LQKTLELKQQEAVNFEKRLSLSGDETLLELGSGFGVMAKHLSTKVKKVICCDIYKEMLDFAAHLNSESKNIDYLKINSFDLTAISDDSIDTVYSTGVFIHFNIYDTNMYLKEFKRIIKNGGKLLFNIKNENRLEPHQFFFDANLYAENGHTTKGLQQWMSHEGVMQLANYYGFRLSEPIWVDTDIMFTFELHK
jgi:ubiquinone/menaquinone biosynthesis C-methylase UbiE